MFLAFYLLIGVIIMGKNIETNEETIVLDIKFSRGLILALIGILVVAGVVGYFALAQNRVSAAVTAGSIILLPAWGQAVQSEGLPNISKRRIRT